MLRLRGFLVKNYQSIKNANPTLPILIRESAGVEAIAYYRFGKIFLIQGKGVEKSIRLEGLGADRVQDLLYKFE